MAAIDMSEFAEYPKMKTTTVKDSGGIKRKVPLVYPAKHLKAGQHVVFESAEEEKRYDGTGVAAKHGPEQAPGPIYSYVYDPWKGIG